MKKSIIYISAAITALCSCSSTPEYDASGIFEATETTLSATSPGKILMISADEGDSVNAGQCVILTDTTQASLRLRQFEQTLGATRSSIPDAAVQVAAIRSRIAHQQSERARIERLLARGAATQKQLDDITSTIEVMERELSSALSTLSKTTAQLDHNSAAIATQIEQAAATLADCRIESPVNGTVTERYAQPGEVAQPGRPLVRIADLSSIYLRAYITSAKLSDVELGQSVTVIADFGGGIRHEYPGKIVAIASESEFTPKNIQTDDSRSNLVYAIKIAVTEPDGKIKIGGYGHVRL
ncbi:MAG: HlyD family efflux transporter periplasmic adaptor subunit [Muribaculaceae bacterium]|nr:HlyD family efflux transporter periplasmic adaptor subunit [Muribaculaceae bacterium]